MGHNLSHFLVRAEFNKFYILKNNDSKEEGFSQDICNELPPWI
jgi:hypothetical protein